MTDFTIEDAVPGDLPGIAAILNRAISATTAVWHEDRKSEAEMADWFATRSKGGFPVLVARHEGAVGGYASYGPFRPYSGYRLTVEHSVYVREDLRGQGLGKALLAALIQKARDQKLHVLVGGIEAANAASLALHKTLGFAEVARMPEVGRKFESWLTLVFLQKTL